MGQAKCNDMKRPRGKWRPLSFSKCVVFSKISSGKSPFTAVIDYSGHLEVISEEGMSEQ